MDGEIESGSEEPVVSVSPDTPDVSPGEKELVNRWLNRIKASKKHFKKAFDRMDKCQQLATHGAYKEWMDDESRYVVPILMRHINQAVSQLYAKNPTAVAQRRKRLLHTVWDGTQEQVSQVAAFAALGDMAAREQLLAIQKDIAEAQAQENMVERAAKTLDYLYAHQVSEQPYVFKTKIKQLVRRAKVNGVGYLKINFLREKDMRPETAAIAEDTQAKIRTIQRLQQDVNSGSDDDMEAKLTQLQSLLSDMHAHPDRVVREQIIFDYPRSDEIILDPATRDLKTLAGCCWLAHEFDLTADKIRDIYGVDVAEGMADPKARETRSDNDEQTYRVYEIQDKYQQQVCVVCEGYDRFLRFPAEPDLWFEAFFNVIPLVFNEIEHKKELYPPSDVWSGRHMQFEYNRSREGLREHRIAARPYWISAKGRLEEKEKERLRNHAAHEIVEVMPRDERAPVSSVLEKGPTAPIDPNLYETEGLYTDMQRSVGSQEANLGGTSGATATESSIAENSRMSSLSDNADDLDDMLTVVARVCGAVLFQEMSSERVKEIVGPGAVWPETPVSRRALADEIMLTVKAGSSGRPNQAAKLANIERAWPGLSQLPNINPEPIAEVYADLLDIDFEKMNQRGALSIVAQNAMAAPAPVGSVPQAQGSRGGERSPTQTADGGQPAFPAGESGATVSGIQ